MPHPIARLIVCTVVATPCLSGLCAGEIASQRLGDERISLLNDRATILMPAGAKIEPRSHRPSVANTPQQEETRIVLDLKPQRILLIARETFQTAGDDFPAALQSQLKVWNKGADLATEPLWPAGTQAPTGVSGILVVMPPPTDANSESIRVAQAFVTLADRTILFLSVYANQAAVADLNACRTLARSILQSVQPGGTKLLVEAGPRRFYTFSQEHTLELTVPAGFAQTVQRGPDFIVHHLRAVLGFGKPANTFSLYYGDHPKLLDPAKAVQGAENIPANRMTTSLLGKNVAWHRWSMPNGGQAMLFAETICPSPMPDDNKAFVHIFVAAGEEDDLLAMVKMSQTLKVVDSTDTPATRAATEPATP